MKVKEKNEPFFDNSSHLLFKSMMTLIIILVIGGVLYLYYKKFYSSPSLTFIKSISSYQDNIKIDTNYHKINSVITFNGTSNNESKDNGINILNDLTINLIFNNDKEMTYLEIDTKYKKDAFVNIKGYGNNIDNKYITYLKLDKGYDKYLKFENKYLQYFPLIKLLKEEELGSIIKKTLKSNLSNSLFTRENDELEGSKVSINTLTIKNDDFKKIMLDIINDLKNNTKLSKKTSNYYNDFDKTLDKFIEQINNNKNDYVIKTYNKLNITQDLIKLEFINETKNTKVIFTPSTNNLVINYHDNMNIDITKNSDSSYRIIIEINKKDYSLSINGVINLEEEADVTELTINDDMLITELNKDTLNNIINDINDENIKDVLKLFQK